MGETGIIFETVWILTNTSFGHQTAWLSVLFANKVSFIKDIISYKIKPKLCTIRLSWFYCFLFDMYEGFGSQAQIPLCPVANGSRWHDASNPYHTHSSLIQFMSIYAVALRIVRAYLWTGFFSSWMFYPRDRIYFPGTGQVCVTIEGTAFIKDELTWLTAL